jgi:hypothetical protein
VFLSFARPDGQLEDYPIATPAIIYREVLPSVSVPAPSILPKQQPGADPTEPCVGPQVVRLNRPGKSPSDIALRCGATNGTESRDGLPRDRFLDGLQGQPARRQQDPRCEDPNFYRSVMQERYPEISVFKCNTK